MSQIKAEIILHTNVKLNFHKDVGLKWYQWIPDFCNIRFEQNNLMEKNYSGSNLMAYEIVQTAEIIEKKGLSFLDFWRRTLYVLCGKSSMPYVSTNPTFKSYLKIQFRNKTILVMVPYYYWTITDFDSLIFMHNRVDSKMTK